MSEADSNIPHPVKKHKRGDVREDGMVFNHYYFCKGSKKEHWITAEKLAQNRALNNQRAKDRFAKMPLERKKEENKRKHEKIRSDPAKVERQRIARKAWQKRNKDYLNAKHKEKRDNDPVFATAHRVRRLTNFAFERKGYKKNGTSEQLLGCTWDQLKTHIESKFLPGMSWENRHEWHVDHIVPLASAKSVEEIENLCKWHNLQPLWRLDNLKKGAKITVPNSGELP